MNRKGLLALLLCLLTLPATAQYCAAALGCACSVPYADEYIANVSFGTLNNSSGCQINPSYSDFTAVTGGDMFPGTANAISVTIGNYWSSDEIFVWCDWNNDFVFDNATELVGSGPSPCPACPGGGAGPATWTGSITPPALASGSTRMRVILRYANSTPNSCPTPATSGFGEVEDYTVNLISGPIPCTTSFSSPGGPGTILVSNNPCAPLAGAAYFWAFTFAQGTTPAGNWHGLDIGLAQLVNWYLSGYPFTGSLDGAGASSFAAGGLPSGLQFWQVTTTWAPGYGTFLLAYPVTSYTIP
jgi:hypothetical protein